MKYRNNQSLRYTRITLAGIVFVTIVLSAIATPAMAAAPAAGPDCGGVQTAIEYNCTAGDNPIYGLAKGFMQILAALAGIVIVGAIIVGGIGYASARDDKGQIAKSIDIIRNAIIALLLFIGMGAILNALIPGGIL